MAANDPGPYVDTTGGKMPVVVLCYYNGTAWAGPAAPGPFVPSPGGMIQCVGAFVWNGSAWVAQTNLGQ